MNKKQITLLEQELIYANKEYNNNGTSPLSDDEYDTKKQILKKHKPDSMLFTTVGATAVGVTVKHSTPMLSLDDYWDYKELPQVIKDLDTKRDLLPEFKYDGIAVSVKYVDGKLNQVLMRGDGIEGEIITEAAKHVNGIPTLLDSKEKGTVEVKGEIFLPFIAFEKLKETLGYANPRNSVAGLFRRKDTDSLKGTGLCFMPYEVSQFHDIPFMKYTDMLLLVALNGIGCFKDPEIASALSFMYKLSDGYKSFALSFSDVTNAVLAQRGKLPFGIDGVVFKHNLIEERNRLGITNRVPRWAIAFKFPGDSGVTTLNNIEWQVSRNGVLTPVGKIEAIPLGGVVYTSVTLHNMNEIQRLNLKLGDKILLERRGDVIPKVMSVVETDKSKMFITPPIFCPCCGESVIPVDTTLRCTNEKCPEQLALRIAHFASRKAMDIEDLAEATARALVNHNILYNVDELYLLTEKDLMELPGFAEVSSKKLINAIQASKSKGLNNILFGLGIDDVGESTAKVLAGVVGSLSELLSYRNNIDMLDLLLFNCPLNLVSTTARKALQHYVNSIEGFTILSGLIKNGIDPTYKSNKVSAKLEGQSWVITGSFPGINRDTITELLTSNGANVSSSVSKLTTGVIVGDNAGNKAAVAYKLKIPTYSLEDIKNKLNS